MVACRVKDSAIAHGTIPNYDWLPYLLVHCCAFVRVCRVLTAMAEECPSGQAGAVALGVVPAATAWLRELSRGEGDVSPAAAEECAVALEALLYALLAGGRMGGANGGGGGSGSGSGSVLAVHAGVKAAMLGAEALPTLVVFLKRAQGEHAAAGRGGRRSFGGAAAAAAAAGVPGSAVGAAAVLTLLAEGDVDIQNELATEGALAAAAGIVQDGDGAAATAALGLVSAMLRRNTYVKNTARQGGLPAALVGVVRRCGLAQSATAAAAAAALAELVSGNHQNQEVVTVEGGLDVAVGLAREAVAALPLAAAAALDRTAGEISLGGAGTLARTSSHGPGEWRASGDGSAPAVSNRSAAAGPGGATAACRLVRALFGLLAASVELHSGNSDYVRELGGVTVVGEFLVAGVEALLAARGNGGGGSRQRAMVAALSPALAAACGAVVALCSDSEANQSRLEVGVGCVTSVRHLWDRRGGCGRTSKHCRRGCGMASPCNASAITLRPSCPARRSSPEWPWRFLSCLWCQVGRRTVLGKLKKRQTHGWYELGLVAQPYTHSLPGLQLLPVIAKTFSKAQACT